ncbi:MAG: glutamate-5-semialdehyde dehydrogenase [Cyanobacteriota bacterium]
MVKTRHSELKYIAKKAKEACWKLSSIDTDTKNKILKDLADALKENYESIKEANNKDLDAAEKLVNAGGLSKSLYKRLALTESKFSEMLNGVVDVSRLVDPIGNIELEVELDDGLILRKVSCPIGVIGVIFESRPDVIVQISSLAIKSSNAVILKGGSEAINTNVELVKIINKTLARFEEYPESSINLIKTREEVNSMLELDEYIDLLIPRGSNEFVKYIQNNTRIPVLGHADGICHIYIDNEANPEMAYKVCLDSKTDYPAACNAVETILIHKDLAAEFLKDLLEKFLNANVEVRCQEAIINKFNLANVSIAKEEDWSTEYGDLIISIKEVNSLEDAINHINSYGSGHTDCIITSNKEKADKFMNFVDSSSVYWNASTRFADGFRYGFGAEVGISTNKTHARGPVGLEGLVIYKYKLYGNGQIVSDYSKGLKTFKHKVVNNN